MTQPVGGFRVEVTDDIMNWTVWFSGPQGTPYYPGQYRAQLTFTNDFPYKPPNFRILSSFWHPNVYTDGRICISILHPPGTDELNSAETAMMRWTPVQSIRTVLISIISLLSDPDPQDAGAPANVDALVQFRKDPTSYNAKCKANAEKSLSELPEGFVPPPAEDAKPAVAAERGMSFLCEAADYEEAEEAPSHPYKAELDQLRAMSVGDDRSDEDILALLTKYKGDLSVVTEKLFD